MSRGYKITFFIFFIIALGSILFYFYKSTFYRMPSDTSQNSGKVSSLTPTIMLNAQHIDPSRPYIKSAKVNYTLMGTVSSLDKTASGTILRLTDDSGKVIPEILTISTETEVLSIASKSASTQRANISALTPGVTVQVIATGDLQSGNTANLLIVSILIFAK